MKSENVLKRKIEVNYASTQAFYWAANCTLIGFLAVFLSYQGLNDGQIGIVSSLFCVAGIFVQLFVSDFSDQHSKIPLKKIIGVLYLISLGLVGLLYVGNLPILLFGAVYIIAAAILNSGNGLLNALMMRYLDSGLDVNYGLPRGFGSIGYALSAFFIGLAIEKMSPNILMPLFLVVIVIALIAVMRMPVADTLQQDQPVDSVLEKISYKKMLLENTTLRIFLVAIIFSGLSQTAIAIYLIRIIESLGGTTKELGIAMLIQAGVEVPMMFLSSFLLRKFKVEALVFISIIAFSLKTVGVTFAPSLGFIYVVMAFSMFCYGIYGFSSVMFVNKIVAPNQKVRGQSLIALCFVGGIASIIGNVIFGTMLDLFGLKSVLYLSCCFGFVSVMVMAACMRAYRRK